MLKDARRANEVCKHFSAAVLDKNVEHGETSEGVIPNAVVLRGAEDFRKIRLAKRISWNQCKVSAR